MAETAADAREAPLAARNAAGARVLASGATIAVGVAALAAWTAAGACILASGATIAVGVAAASSWVFFEDNVFRGIEGCCQASRESVSCGDRRNNGRRSNSAGRYQWIHEIQFRYH